MIVKKAPMNQSTFNFVAAVALIVLVVVLLVVLL